MRTFLSRYEMEIRLGLVVIVVLLLVLNFSSTYVLHSTKRELGEAIDQKLLLSLNLATHYLNQNQTSRIPADQVGMMKQRFGVSGIGVYLASTENPDSIILRQQEQPYRDILLPPLGNDDIKRLKDGEVLFRCSDPKGLRFGMTMVKKAHGGNLLVVSQVESWILDLITAASKKTLYFAAAVLLLIIPITISLPRLILRPFKRMKETARSAGRLSPSDNGDEVTEVIKSYENIINELKDNEAELKELYRESSHKANHLEKLNRYILKSIGSGVINIDLAGKVIGYNRAAVDILGYDEEMVVNKHYLVAFPAQMELGLMIEAGLERGEAVGNREIEISRGTHRAIWLSVQSSLIFDDNDRVIGVTLLLTETTEFKKLQTELEMNRRLAALGEMTGGLAHQLRNSMAAISGFCQLIQKRTTQNEALNDLAASIRTEAATSETMVSRFLNFARPLSLNEEVFDLRNLLTECMEKFNSETARRNIQISLFDSTDETAFIGDKLLLKEAIGNLLDNAIGAIDSDGRIEIELQRTNSRLDLLISDSGPGIPNNILDKIFTPFFSSKPSGTGLGLALAQKIIHLHKGNIVFEPNIPRGTICHVIFSDRMTIDKISADWTTDEFKKV
jgi:PAS domain S-box-containing protein